MIFARANDHLLPSATIAVASGTPQAGYPATNLFNRNWASPFWIAETTLDLRFDFGTAVLPQWVVLGNSNLTVAAKWQGHPTDSWGTPDVDLTFGIPALSGDGLFSSPHLNLSALAAKRWWRLLVTTNASPVMIGELLLAATRKQVGFYDVDSLTIPSEGQNVVHATMAGVGLAYEQATRQEVTDGRLVLETAELAEIEALVQSARFRARPFWMVPQDTGTDAWLVRLQTDQIVRTPVGGGWLVPFPVQQLSRGLPWVDPN